MDNLLLWIARLLGLAGAIVCVAAIGVRLSGQFWLGSFQLGTLLLAGMALMVGGCLCFLAVIAARTGPR